MILAVTVDAFRFGHGLINCPPAPESVFQRPPRDAKRSGPIRHCLDLTTPFNHPIAASVVRLLRYCGPPHIPWFVAARVVDTVKRVLRGWFRPDVIEECLERLSPFMAHRYSAGSVSLVARVGFFVTPAQHSHVAVVFRCAVFTVDGVSFYRHVPLAASARPGVTSLEIGSEDYRRSTAFAEAFPKRRVVAHASESDHRQAVHAVSDAINYARHANILY